MFSTSLVSLRALRHSPFSQTQNRYRARLAVELLEDRSVPSAYLFDPLLSLDDLFTTDPALAETPAAPAHASGDLKAPLAQSDNKVTLAGWEQYEAFSQNQSKGFGAAATSLAASNYAQFLNFSLVASLPIPLISGPNVNISHARFSPLVLPPPSVELNLAQYPYIPVNADNDNGSNVTNGIPAKRDFNVSPLPKIDPDLVQAVVQAVDVGAGGAWTMNLTQKGQGKISLWTDQKKTSAFTGPPAGQLVGNFWIEGTHESAKANDISLSFTYTIGGQSYTSNTQNLAVTPIISSYTVTPGLDADDPNKQNIVFDNGMDGTKGLDARTPGGLLGANFKSVATQVGLSGDFRFIQVMTGVVNGNNGTTNAAGTAVGWLYQDKTGQVLQLRNGGFPVLDVSDATADQTNVFDFNSSVSADKTTVTITFADAPTTGSPPNGGQGVAVDILDQFRTYIVWRWQQVAGNSNGAKVPVFYFLAFSNWQVNFWGTTPNAMGPITLIRVLNGVTADANYTQSNADPGANALDLNRILNGNLHWVAA
jgi:hypothetical protein